MKKSFISLFLLTLILSHFSILNLLASGQLRRIWKYAAMVLLCLTVGVGNVWGYTTDPNTWIGTSKANAPTYAEQFKWSALAAITGPKDVVNIQNPGFANANWGIYVTFPAADFNQVYYNGILKTDGTDFKIDGAGILFYISSLTAQNTEIVLKNSGAVKYGLNIYNKNGGTALYFPWTTTVSEGGKNWPKDGDFSYSGAVGEGCKYWNTNWAGMNGSITATSRETYSLKAGTYTFTLSLQWSGENRDNCNVPKIQLNSGTEFTYSQVNLSNGIAICIPYTVTVPADGDYTIKVITQDGDRDKFGVSTLTIPESAFAPSGYSLTYDCNEGTSGCPSNASNQTALPDPLPAGPTAAGYTFGGWYTNEGLTVAAVAGAAMSDDVTLYAKMTPYYFNYNYDKASSYGHYSMAGELSYTQALDGNSTYYFYFNDGGSHQYALGGASTMTSSSCTDWNFTIDYNTYCGISTTAPGDYVFTIDESDKTNKLVVSVEYPSSVAITLARNDGSGSTTTWYAATGGTIPTPPDPSDRDGYAFEGWYANAECTTPWVWSTTVDEATTLYAKWVNAWYFHELWSDPAWKAQLMTRSTNGTYWYLHTYASDENRYFKIQSAGNWYNYTFNSPGYLCTDITMMNSTADSWNAEDSRCAVKYNSGRYYILVFPPNTSANSTSDPIICASTYLPEEYYTVPSSRTIYFDNSSAAWTNIYFRKGRSCHSEATALSLVPGTASLYKVTTASAYTGYQAFHLANNQSATGSSSIYTVNGGGKAITKATVFQKYNLDADVTFTPGDAEGDPSDGCQYYDVEKTTGMKTDNVAITAPTNGTIRVSYTNTSGSSANFTSGNADLAHTCIITPTGIGNTGYEVSVMTINGNSHTSGNTYTITGATTIAATFKLIDYNVTYSAPSNGSYTIQVADESATGATKTANMGQTITLAATPSSGYVFSSWTITRTDNSTDVTSSVSLSSSTNKDATFTMPAYGVTVTATFEETTCTNTYTIDCGSTADYVVPTSGTRVPSTQSNEAGIYTNYYTGYHGEGYYDFKKATYSEIYYAVHLPAAQYTFEVYTATDKDGQYINVYRRTDGESGDISYGGYYYTKMISQPNSYNNNLAFGVGRTISEQNLAEEDYIIGLYSNGDYAAYDQVVITANSDVFCRASTTYDVTITGSPAAGQASATGAGSYEEGATVTINATPNRGYSFNTWSADPSVSFSSAATTASNSFSMPASDVALTASYNTLTSRTVTVNNDGNGSGSADLNPAYVGETVTLTATPNTGYRFVNWTTSDGVSFASSTSASTTFTMLDKNVTVTANFALVDNVIASGNANTMTGSYHDDQGSTLSGENVDADCVFEPNNVFKFTYTGFDGSGKYYGMDITKDAGYNSALSDGATGIGFYYMTEADNDGLAFCLDPKGNGGGSQYKMQLAATDGAWTYVYVAHSEADDWDGTFRFWINSNDNATDGDAATTTQQASGHFYIANISATAVTSKPTISKYAVTVSSNNDSYGTASGAGNFFDCESVTVTASKNNESYTFDGWYQGETRKSTELSYTFTMNDLRGESSSVALQARFSVSGYVVNYEVEGGNGTITSVVDGSSNPVSSGGRVASGTVLTFTASPSSGYAVLGWYTWLNSTETLQGNTQNNNTFTYTVTQDITIRVRFDTPYTLTLNSSPASATVSGGGSYVQGTVVSVSTSNENGDYTFVHWMDGERVVSTSAASDYVMPASNKTLTAVWRLSRISSLSWAGSEDLGSGMEIASSCFDGGCFDSEITFTFTEGGTVNYYANNDHEKLLGTVYSGTAITLDDDLRTHGIYIKCTEGSATLIGVSKTTVGSVYEIWSATRSKLGAVVVGDWYQQVVLGPEHFQTAAEGDVLRVNTSDEGGDAQGALQYIYTAGGSHTYKGLDDYTDGGLHNWDLSDEQKDQHYFEITINETHLANLKRYGAIVKGRNYTIQSVELRASCSNQTMRTTAPDKTTYGEDGSIDIMTNKLKLEGKGFDLGDWKNKLELDERCFNNVTVGSIINFYMKVEDGATLSFRCNVDSVHAKSYKTPPLCPSYGDISFDRTIDDLYGAAPTLIGRIEGYKVLYLLVDADMLRRLKETGMILCGKGTLIKVVEGVPETVVVNPGEEKKVPTVVNNLTIYQGGEVTNDEDIEVLGKITYIRHAKGGALSNKLDQWYTFALPFTVSDVEVLDVVEEPDAWYDINAVYYSDDATDQDDDDPDGAGHYYLQYLKAENATAIGSDFAARWQYITPGHSLACVSQWVANNGTRYGYPKKDEAYIILFDSDQPIGSYFQTNTQIRFVGGPQTIDGVAKEWTVEADGEQYWMYANNTLHSFTLPDAYILNEDGTKFVLQESPTIRPFECYVQATESLKEKCPAISMRGFRIDNTTTGAESIQGSAIRAEKILRNGQLIIIRNGVEYDATGVVIR